MAVAKHTTAHYNKWFWTVDRFRVYKNTGTITQQTNQLCHNKCC